MTPSTNVPDPRDQINGLEGLQTKNTGNCSTSINARLSSSPASIKEAYLSRQSELRLIKKAEVLKLASFSNSTLHLRINAGLMPPSVSLGGRAVAFVQHEIQAVLAALVAGQTNEEIMYLITELVNLRQDLFTKEVLQCNS